MLHDFLKNTPLANREWRLANIYTIRDDKGKIVKFRPNLAQRQFYNSYWFCNHVLKARKLGLSTFIEILYLDDLLFTASGLKAGIIDYTIEDAKDKLAMFKLAYDHLDDGDIHPDTWRYGAAIKRAIPIISAAVESITFGNGSRIRVSTSLRGSTPNRIHLSEFGKIAIFTPIKAREIINGAFNSMTPGSVRNTETTHEGGKYGENYRLMQIAMKSDPAKLTSIESRFHFFPWYEDPRYVLPSAGQRPRPETTKYFESLRDHHNLNFTPDQIFWYDRKSLEQGYGMKKEFPTTPGEAFESIANGAIYGREMADLRAAGRITDFGAEASLPLFTFWDIGLSDYTAVWLIQPVGRWHLVLDWFEAEGKNASSMTDAIRRMEQKWRRPIACHYLPHDANTRAPGTGKSYTEELKLAGLHPIKIVPRIGDKWLGIGFVRDTLPHCWFHRTNCDTSREFDGTPRLPDSNAEEFPSGVACLEGYSKNVSPSATTLREMPKHDIFSHSADAFRTFAEALRQGMIDTSAPSATQAQSQKPKVTGTARRSR